jgi:membrane fusion protein (multidrug efflux system)
MSMMSNMARRMILMIVVVAALLGALGTLKYRQIQAAIAQASAFQPPPEAVTTVIAKQERWPVTVSAIGNVSAVRGVTVSADLPGVIEKIAFESGQTVRAGDLLVQLDTRQERALLASAEARQDLARANLERIGGLLKKKVTSQAEYDASAAEYKQSQAQVEGTRATIARKTIRAPFAGVLGIRQVNTGQYMTDGDPVAPLQALDPVHVTFSVPQQNVALLRVGQEVHVTLEGTPNVDAVAKITAIDSVVDEATRNIQVQATLPNPGMRLRPGMFVQVQVSMEQSAPVIALPATAISHAPYGDSVFVVKDLAGPNGVTYRGVAQQFVKLGGDRGDQVAVVSGLEPGQEVVTSGVFKLRNGGAVLVNNGIQPENNPAPKPEDS